MSTDVYTAPSLSTARQRIAQCQAALALAGRTLRPPPPEPTTCCGRGCNGCVWEGYYGALEFWLEDAQNLLHASPQERPVQITQCPSVER